VKGSASLRRAVERALPDTVAFLQELVRVPSLLGNEEAAQRLVEDRLTDLGFVVRSIEPNAERLAGHPESGIPLRSYEGRRCLVGMFREGAGGRSLLLNGHVDVVSVGTAEQWTKPPFGAQIDGGRLYGRGACDMKGGIAAMLLGVEAALADGPPPGGLVYQSVIEEECGGNGTLAACLEGPTADAVVIAEPTNGALDLIAVGVIWARVTIAAQARHASESDEGSHPIQAAFAVIEALQTLEAELNSNREPEFADVERPYLLNVGAVHAGDWPSSTPGEAVLDVRLGLPIRMGPAAGQARLADAVRSVAPAARVDFRGFRAPGYAFERGTPLVDLLSSCHEAVHGRRPEPEPSRATTDLRFFAPPLGPGQAVCYGPTGGGLHGVDEWVDLDSIADVATVLALLFRRWGQSA
jgi:acetylornithine deacetylase